jgi:hypothetical protein
MTRPIATQCAMTAIVKVIAGRAVIRVAFQ